MIALEHHARPVVAELLPPGADVPGSVSAPWAVKVWRVEQRAEHVVQFEDGGVWGLPDRELQHIDPDDVKANVGEIFARWPSRFRFIRREASRYRRRT